MSDSNEKISKALDVEFDSSAPKEITVSKKDIEKIKKEKREVMLSGDFEKARDSITEMISTGMDAVQGIMRVAEAGDSPRAYEVASLLLKTVTEMNKDLIDIHKKAKDAEKENVTIKNTTNNSIYVGSTTDLQNLINKSRSQYKDLPEAEVIDSEDDDGEQSVQ
jgi:hypothetical protein